MPRSGAERRLRRAGVTGFTNGHLWFNQYVQKMPGHELPANEPVTVHFTFQFGDTQEYPHGKRQRAREAGDGKGWMRLALNSPSCPAARILE